MKRIHYYDVVTGVIDPCALSFFGPDHDAFANANCRPGFSYFVGECDPVSQRVDVSTKQLVDYLPPAPDEFHEWNSSSRRWELTALRQRQLDEDAQARLELEELDSRALRALTEDRLGITLTKADRDAGAMTLDDIRTAQEAARAKLLKDQP